MTTEQLKQNAAAMLAFAEGKQVEARSSDGSDPWTVLSNPNWTFYSVEYRPKPEPVTRPWSKPDDVPGPVCWLRNNEGFCALVIGLCETGPIARTPHPMRTDNSTGAYRWSNLSAWEHSTDLKNWFKCEVTEPAR